jgi:hypothetical protein
MIPNHSGDGRLGGKPRGENCDAQGRRLQSNALPGPALRLIRNELGASLRPRHPVCPVQLRRRRAAAHAAFVAAQKLIAPDLATTPTRPGSSGTAFHVAQTPHSNRSGHGDFIRQRQQISTGEPLLTSWAERNRPARTTSRLGGGFTDAMPLVQRRPWQPDHEALCVVFG